MPQRSIGLARAVALHAAAGAALQGSRSGQGRAWWTRPLSAMPTLAEIARMTGLSKSGVSLALRHHPSIPRETQERVAEAARFLGYRVNPLVAANMMHVRDVHRQVYQATIAFVWRGEGPARIFDFKPQVEGARQRAADLGFSVDLFDMSGDELTAKRLNQILRNRSIRAVILAGAVDQTEGFTLDWDDLCVVVTGHSFPWLPTHRVGFDTYSAVAGALERVAAMGYRRVGFVMLRSSLERDFGLPLAGFEYFRRHHKELVEIPPLISESTKFDLFPEWFLRHRPEVVLSNHWPELHAHLQSMGLTVPGDVGYTGIASLPWAASVSGFHQRYESLGATATSIVSQMLIRGEFGIPGAPTTTLLKGVWNDGVTLAPKVAREIGASAPGA